MNKIKISFAAIAFLLATGAAFATKATTGDLPPCGSAGTSGCAVTNQADCCIQSTPTGDVTLQFPDND